jgi:hypothetical protein
MNGLDERPANCFNRHRDGFGAMMLKQSRR